MQPVTLCAYEVDSEPIFDARDDSQRAALGVADSVLARPSRKAEMLEGTTPSSQALADRLMAAGYVGMFVRSFAAGAGAQEFNLVLWNWGKYLPSRVTLIDDEGRLSGEPGS